MRRVWIGRDESAGRPGARDREPGRKTHPDPTSTHWGSDADRGEKIGLLEIRELCEPGRAVSRLAPDHGEERLVERQVTMAAIARVRQIHTRLVEARLHWDEMRDQRHARDGSTDVRRRAVPREAVVEGSATRLHDDGDEVEVGA